MGILISLFFIVIFVVLLIVLFVLGFIRSIFSFGRRTNSNNQQASQQPNPQPTNKSRAKIFDKNEGEYADFEEIK
jgi:flagellar basal body-associated protein FliL